MLLNTHIAHCWNLPNEVKKHHSCRTCADTHLLKHLLLFCTNEKIEKMKQKNVDGDVSEASLHKKKHKRNKNWF